MPISNTCRLILIGAALSFSLAACSNSGSTASPLAPTPASVTPPKSEVFTGTVVKGSSVTHNFTVAVNNGQITVTLTQAGPPDNVGMGVGIGAPAADGCQYFSGATVITAAGATPQLTGSANAGTYCVSVVDVGYQTEDVTYSLTVTHY